MEPLPPMVIETIDLSSDTEVTPELSDSTRESSVITEAMEADIEEPAPMKDQKCRKSTGGKAQTSKSIDGDEARMLKIQRTYEQLSFSNPGKLFADIGRERKGRRRNAFTKPKKVKRKAKAHYDGKGQFVHPENDKPVRMCDCLDLECTGCFPPCLKCNSTMCGPLCQINRSMIPISIVTNGMEGKTVRNPLLTTQTTRRKNYDVDYEETKTSESEDDTDSDY